MFLDVPDALVRRVLGRGHWPPYSLRAFVGGAQRFDDAGNWFLEDLLRLRLLDHGTRVLEIGCGCGRIARPLATDGRPSVLSLKFVYTSAAS
jgi:cyclopropane fatty-acyl-phospholipid synthase-like methyltransferase